MNRRVWWMRRREFIAGLAGAATLPMAARAQQPRMRRVGALMYYSESGAPGANSGEPSRPSAVSCAANTWRRIKSDSSPPENTLGWHYTPKSAPRSRSTS